MENQSDKLSTVWGVGLALVAKWWVTHARLAPILFSEVGIDLGRIPAP
jgi:hypothetical protein